MSVEVIALLVLVLVLIATIRNINMGALALVAAFVVGLAVYDVTADDVVGGFPGDLFVILVGVTYLFALAKNNGTVDYILHVAVRAVRGRVALVPWAMFVVRSSPPSERSVPQRSPSWPRWRWPSPPATGSIR